MTIETGKYYTTRRGSKVKIYSTDGNYLDQVHGAMFHEGFWVPEYWNKDGKYHYQFEHKESHLDLVGPWVDPGDCKFDIYESSIE